MSYKLLINGNLVDGDNTLDVVNPVTGAFEAPFRGARQSSVGVENGQEGIEEYTQARIINVAL
jgi:acyl-CoA reductase-like NAD-dependent aldehyde dehydrogenase